jgi:hypothetical protein
VARPKFDGVVEAVHISPDGNIDWARTYLRRGPTFSDYILMSRQDLIEHIKAGKKFIIGRRVAKLASTFEEVAPVRVVQKDGTEVLVSGDNPPNGGDHLEGALYL